MAYNGWHNYETWNVALWLGNEEYSDSHMCELTGESSDVYGLADKIESYVMGQFYESDIGQEASMFNDLLGAALRNVQWDDIAEHYWNDREIEYTAKMSGKTLYEAIDADSMAEWIEDNYTLLNAAIRDDLENYILSLNILRTVKLHVLYSVDCFDGMLEITRNRL